MNKITTGLLAATLLVAPQVWADEVYKHIDENGIPSFSDTNNGDAEKITVDPVNVQEFPTPPSLPPLKSSQPKPAVSYSELTISSPADQTTFHNEPTISIALALKPELKQGHSVELLDNGAVLRTGQGTNFQLNDFDRGSHTLTARIVDKKGKIYISSQPVTIYVFRHIIQKQNKKAPAN